MKPDFPPELADVLAERALSLLRVNSVIGQERELADHMEAWARQHFSPDEIVRQSHSFVLGTANDTRPSIALVGHLDTVPPPAAPNPVRREGERIYGLGSSDMKGGLAVMMQLAESLRRETLPVNVLWVFYEREEGPYAESGLPALFEAAPHLLRARFAVALEPTDSVIQVGCVGSLHARVVFSGTAAHSARPWQGVNAIHRAGDLLVRLSQRAPRIVRQGAFEFSEVISATRANGGQARNVIPDRFELNLNYRFAPGKSVAQAEADLRAFVGSDADVDITDRAPSGRVCDDNPFFQAFVQSSGLPVAAKQAWTDVARFAEHGVDAVNFGPGETAQAHQAKESAPVSALATACEKLAAFLIACDVPVTFSSGRAP